MTTEQKAKAWDLLKESVYKISYSSGLLIGHEAKGIAKDFFNTMCSAEMTVIERFPNLGKDPS